MAETRNNFLASKMNKDLDARLVPPGEYRDAQNVMISKSEGEDVGALENVLGNLSITDFGLSNECNIDIIGRYMDVVNDRIVVFMTNYIDTSSDKLSNFASTNAKCYVGCLNVNTLVPTLLVSGSFLNFSKTHPVIGVDLLEDLLFWTDNRNQPRKININTAISNTSYYTLEDHISVAKYYPHKCIDLYSGAPGAAVSTMKDVVSEYLPIHGLSVLNIDNPSTITFTLIPGVYSVGVTGTLNPGDKLLVTSGGGYDEFIVDTATTAGVIETIAAATTTYAAGTVVYHQRLNPNYDSDWSGDPEYFKDKFVRFSYRFKFDDDEYSLIAPFTQPCFIPEQDGYFIRDDEDNAFKSTHIEWLQNKVNDISLIINAPDGITGFDDLSNDLKVTEIDILYKQSDELGIKVVDTIPSSVFGLETNSYYSYSYKSQKPYKVLPNKDLIRVYDQTPVRALSQAVSGNRVIYGNYINKHTAPSSLNYNVAVGDKMDEISTSPYNDPASYVRKEYPNHTLKQNRTYQVGVVLSDRYGRQSTVILSDIDAASTLTNYKGSTIFNPYKSSPFSEYTGAAGRLFSSSDTWPGDALSIQFNTIIDSIKSSNSGEPGLYSLDNPLGWYSYKIVVKQTEQEYYNVFFPGLLNGYIDGESASPSPASSSDPTSHMVLSGDNVNKVPRDLTLVGPNQKLFRTSRPTQKENPNYYNFLVDGTMEFVDPTSAEGERLLKERDREKDLDSGSQLENSNVELFPRVINVDQYRNQQIYAGTAKDSVVTIGTGVDLGLWDPNAIEPYNTAPVFYGYATDPLIGKLSMSSYNIGVTGPSPNASTPTVNAVNIIDDGGGYTIGGPFIYSTFGGSGTGLTLSVNVVGAKLSTVAISNAGSGYKDGDVVNVSEGTTSNSGTVGLTVTDSANAGDMLPVFSTFETTPTRSNLNLFWETSTSGLISELNTLIQDGDILTAVDLSIINWSQTEDLASGIDITNDFYPQNSLGANLTDPSNTGVITSIIDGLGNERKSEFTLVNNGDGSFKMQTNSTFYYGSDANTRESYTIYLDVTVPDGGVGTITSSLAFGPSLRTGSGPNPGVNSQLDNITPTFNVCPGVTLTSTTLGGLIYGFTCKNGSAETSLEGAEITFTITSQKNISGSPVNYFYLQPVLPAGDVRLELTPSVAPPTTYNVTVEAADAGGLTVQCTVNIRVDP